MKTLTAFPIDTATGACLITRKGDPAKVGRIIQLDVDMEQMPRYGVLCISEKGVEILVAQLGMKVDHGNTQDLQTLNDMLRAELTELRAALRNVLAAAELVGVEMVVDRDLVEA